MMALKVSLNLNDSLIKAMSFALFKQFWIEREKRIIFLNF